MKCPVDGTSEMQHIEKEGVQLDYCPACNGVWLDRDELTKLVEVSGIDRRDETMERITSSGEGIPAKKTAGDAFETTRVGGMSGTVRQFDDDTNEGIPAKKTPGDAFETERVGGMSGTVRQFEDESSNDDTQPGIPAKKTPGDAFETKRVGGMSGVVRQFGGKVEKDADAESGDTDDRGSKYDRTSVPVSTHSPWDTGYVGANRKPSGSDEHHEPVEYRGEREMPKDPPGDTAPLQSDPGSTGSGGDHREGMFGDDSTLDRSTDVGFEGAAGTETGTNVEKEVETDSDRGDGKKKSFLERLFGES